MRHELHELTRIGVGLTPRTRRVWTGPGFSALYRVAATGKLAKVRAGTGRPAAGEPLRSSHGYHGAVVSHKVPAAQAKSVAARQTPPAVGRSTISGKLK